MPQVYFNSPELGTKTAPLSRADQAIIDADAIGDIKASLLVRIIASSDGVSVREIFQQNRSRAPIAATRQLAMYMMHVVIGRTLTQVGKFFGRDRTTVAYACARVEDLRDDPTIDVKIDRLEDQFLSTIPKNIDQRKSEVGMAANDKA